MFISREDKKSTPPLSRFARIVRVFTKNDRGATAIEYGMIAALIAVGMLAALQDLGAAVTDTYQFILDQYRVANT